MEYYAESIIKDASGREFYLIGTFGWIKAHLRANWLRLTEDTVVVREISDYDSTLYQVLVEKHYD